MSQSRKIRNAITILTILAMLVMILPMTVMAKGKPDKAVNARKPAKAAQFLKNGKQSGEPQVELDPEAGSELEDEPSDETARPARKSARALFVAARNAWAEENVMPPGHVNILYKYLVASKAIDPSAITQEADTVKAAIDSIQTSFTTLTADSQYFVEGKLSIKALMSAIKSFRLVAEETGVDLDADSEEEIVEDAEADDVEADDVDADDADEAVEDEDEDPADSEGEDTAEALDPATEN